MAKNTLPEIEESLEQLKQINPGYVQKRAPVKARAHKLQKVLVANRGEIAKRFFLSLKEEGIPSVAVVTDVDLGQSWYEMADEVVVIGGLRNYTNIPVIVASALLVGANGIYPGYGFLSEEATFVEKITEVNNIYGTEVIFMGPDAEIMHRVGEKLAARKLAKEQGVPLFEGTESLQNAEAAKEAAQKIGYPVIVKLSAGGGGKGMMPVHQEAGLFLAIDYCQRIGKNLYHSDIFYLEKFIERPVHMEVQIFNGTAVGIRKCAVQRRNQKVIEESGDVFLDSHTTLSMLAAAENMARISGYANGAGAGTVEFLFDPDSQKFGFLEMNVRLQVEHPVTDQSVGIDLAKWQILFFDGREKEIPYELALKRRFVEKSHALEARIYAEDPESDYAPAPGKIQELELPTFNGLRCDFGFKKGDLILPHYDPMIGKVIVEGATREEAITRLDRALSELYIKGVVTNVNQLLRIIRHPEFRSGEYTNRLLTDYKELAEGNPENSNESKLAALFGALAENGRYLRESVNQVFLSRDLENTVQSLRFHKLPISYQVKIYSDSYEIELLQTSLELFYAFIDGQFIGEVELLPRLEGNDDYLIRFGVQYYPVRFDRKPGYSLLRMPDEGGKIHHYKMNITPLGAGDKADPEGMLRAPFQATFVAFCKDENLKRDRLAEGSIVKKGDPIIIVSAMKMETTLMSPIDGKITYLVEDGDLSRLEIGKTPDGLVIGKSLSEGEVLFIVEPEADKQAAQEDKKKKTQRKKEEEIHLLDLLYEDTIFKRIEKDPDQYIQVLLKLVKSDFLGLLPDEKIMKRVEDIFGQLSKDILKKCSLDSIHNEIVTILTFFSGIKRLFSPVLDTNLSFFGELNQFVRMWENDTYRPPYRFRMTLAQLFKAYDVTEWLPKAGADNSRIKLAFFNILRAHSAARRAQKMVLHILDLVSALNTPDKKITNAIKSLIIQLQAERDDSIAVHASKLLKHMNLPGVNRDVIPVISRKYIPEYRNQITDIFSSFEGYEDKNLEQQFQESLKKPEKELISSDFPDWIKKEVAENLETLKKKGYKVERLHSPYKQIFTFSITHSDPNESGYLSIGIPDSISMETDDRGHIHGSPETEIACIHATQVIRGYQKLSPRINNRVEVFATKKPIAMDIASIDPRILSFNTFSKSGMSVLRFFTDISIHSTVVHIDAQHPVSKETMRKKLLLSRMGGRLNLDLLIDHDGRNPYYDGEVDARNQRLFDRDKWPIDTWIDEAFDPGSYSEITIPSIDQIETTDKEGKKTFKPVGGKIFTGTVGKRQAIFYLKDSRISGGASGDLEGLKYVAATYMAYRKNIPLYVWNDGAGANIKEGMVSLNRAAQGFMMNALLGARLEPRELDRYIKNFPDERLKNLCGEVDTIISESSQKIPDGNKYFLVGVGIGSSTGLDVYGSSQMAIQVMVDSEQSYRVLTGSNVIKSVTGEDLTNYEIGGAKVMGKWTGTVDMVAQNKLHLLTYIRAIQEIFVDQQTLPTIARIPSKPESEEEKPSDKYMDVLSYNIIKSNVDHGFFLPMKEEFYGSGSVIGGFARLGGRSVLIMGPRTNFGSRSFATITKAKELMTIARKTGTHQVLVFGENWYHETITEDDLAIRARSDFMRQLSEKKGLRIHIITHRFGLHRVVMNSSADAVIFVKNHELASFEYEIVRKTAAFVVDTIEQAFDTVHKIITTLDSTVAGSGKGEKEIEPKETPEIPADPTQPYDMKKLVIERTFDKGTFIEFFEKMNDQHLGPSLITGFAQLNGQPVGIIADQPSIMGGAPDAPGTEKFRLFTQLVERNGYPMVMLSNAPGFIPGTKQERLRIQQIGAESLDVNIWSRNPVVSVVLNQNFGGRQIHAFSKYLRPGIVYIALKKSVMAVMGASASFDLFQGAKYQELIAAKKNKEASELKANYIAEYNKKAAAENDALSTGVLDWVFDEIKDLRSQLIKGLETAYERVKDAFL